jgi:serine/threonine protein kinase
MQYTLRFYLSVNNRCLDFHFDPLTNGCCLVTEVADGNLTSHLGAYQNGLTEATAKPLLYQLFMGLSHCHMNNVIHRDIKPGSSTYPSNDS